MRVASAISSNWKKSWYQAISRCRTVAGAARCVTESAVRVRTRSGRYIAVSQATAAPQSCPTTCTVLSPLASGRPATASRTAATSATELASLYASLPAGRPERPKPRRSGAITRKPASVRAGTWWRHSPASSGQPCRRSPGSPWPCTSTWSSTPLDVTRMRTSSSVPRATARRPALVAFGQVRAVDAGAQETRVAGRVGAVGELVDRARQRQVPYPRVGDRLAQRRGEPAGAKDQVGPVEEPAGAGVERRREPEPVVQRGDGFHGLRQVPLAGLVGVGGDRGRQGGGERRPARKPRERGAKPLAVRRVLPVHQQAQPHQVTGQAGGDDARAEVVARLGAPAGEGLLLVDAPPLAGQDVAPHVVGGPGRAPPGAGQPARAVVEHLPRGELREPLRGRGQPVPQGEVVPRVEAQQPGQPAAKAGDLDPVPRDAVGFPGDGEPDRVAAELTWQAAGEHGGDERRVAARLAAVGGADAIAEEHLQPRPPVVVSGALGVVPGDVRSRTDQRRRVLKRGELLREQRADHGTVEVAGKLKAGDETRSHASDPPVRRAACLLVF